MPSGAPVVVEQFESLRSWPSADFVVTARRRIEFRQLSLMRITGNAYDGVIIPALDETPGMLQELLSVGRAIGRWWAAGGMWGGTTLTRA